MNFACFGAVQSQMKPSTNTTYKNFNTLGSIELFKMQKPDSEINGVKYVKYCIISYLTCS